MTKAQFEFDLVILTAGNDEREALQSLLARPSSLGIRELRFTILKHPRRDPGCLRESAQVLENYRSRAEFALVLFDWEGSGREETPASQLETEVEISLSQSGWTDRCAAVVIAPELEAWVWSDSPHVAVSLGSSGDVEALRQWLAEEGFEFHENGKPERPKEAMEACLRRARIPRSASVYGEIAARVSLNRCGDPKFLRLRQMLKNWFGVA